MTIRCDLIAEAEQHSRAALDTALLCLDYGNRKPIAGPAMVGCACGFAVLGIAMASIGVFAGILEAAQASDPVLRNTSAV